MAAILVREASRVEARNTSPLVSCAEGNAVTGPRPREPTTDPEEAARNRRLDCANQSRCLRASVVGNWPAFACGTGCYERPTRFHAQLEHEGLTVLRLAIEGKPPW